MQELKWKYGVDLCYVLYCISSTQVSSASSVSPQIDGSVYSPCDECSCLCFASAKPLTRGICLRMCVFIVHCGLTSYSALQILYCLGTHLLYWFKSVLGRCFMVITAKFNVKDTCDLIDSSQKNSQTVCKTSWSSCLGHCSINRKVSASIQFAVIA